MTQPNILELAKQGDAKAIALLLNRQLQPKGITAAASLKDGCLQVMLESVEVPSQQVMSAWVSKSIAGLGAASIEKVKVYGRQTGAKVPAWTQEFEVAGQNLPVANVTQQQASSSENTESNQLSLKERAKLGDVDAIASLLNLPLQNKGISATASLQDGCLQVMLEGVVVPDEEASIRIVRRELTNLKAGAIASVKVYGQQAGEDFPAWNREFEIEVQAQSDLRDVSKVQLKAPIKIFEQFFALIKERNFKELSKLVKIVFNENSHYKKVGIIVVSILFITIFLNTIKSTESNSLEAKDSDTEYKKMLEQLIKRNFDRELDVKNSMAVFDKAGGFQASKKRAMEICIEFKKGSSIEEVATNTVPVNKAEIILYGKVSQSVKNEEELSELIALNAILLNEVIAANLTYCPEFGKNQKFEIK